MSRAAECTQAQASWEAGLEATLAWVEEQHGGPLADDVAVMLLANGAGAAGAPGARGDPPDTTG